MEVKEGQIYKHFKGDLYRVLHIAIHTETNEKLVVYQAIYDESKIFARPYDMFVSKVDRDKYPEVDAEYRFTPFDETDTNQINPQVLAFLDTDNFAEKLRILREMRDTVTNDMLNTMAFSVDFIFNEGTTEEKYEELLNCIALRERFEGARLR